MNRMGGGGLGGGGRGPPIHLPKQGAFVILADEFGTVAVRYRVSEMATTPSRRRR
jgi:hypothetical protein